MQFLHSIPRKKVPPQNCILERPTATFSAIPRLAKPSLPLLPVVATFPAKSPIFKVGALLPRDLDLAIRGLKADASTRKARVDLIGVIAHEKRKKKQLVSVRIREYRKLVFTDMFRIFSPVSFVQQCPV